MATKKKILKLTEGELKDYLYCPLYYNIKRYSAVNIEEEPTLTKLLTKVGNAFAARLLGGIAMSPTDLVKTWDRVISKYENYPRDKITKGAQRLKKFHDWASKRQLLVFDYNSEYGINISLPDGYLILYTGHLGIIIPDGRGGFENLIVNFSSRLPDQYLLDNNVKISLDHWGFKKKYDVELTGTRMLHVKSGKEFFTTRAVELDKRKLGRIIKNVTMSKEKDIWYPHETPLCTSCSVKEFCTNYDGSVKYRGNRNQ